jgi:hypothetical protein
MPRQVPEERATRVRRSARDGDVFRDGPKTETRRLGLGIDEDGKAPGMPFGERGADVEEAIERDVGLRRTCDGRAERA